MNDLWIETGSISMNKHGETLCGDKVELAGGTMDFERVCMIWNTLIELKYTWTGRRD